MESWVELTARRATLGAVIDFGVTYYSTAWEPAPAMRLALRAARKTGRAWINPWSSKVSRSFQYIRHLPRGLRLPLELTRELLPKAHLLVEGTERELLEELKSAGIARAVLLPNRTIEGRPVAAPLIEATREMEPHTNVLFVPAQDLRDSLIEEAESRSVPLWIPAPRSSSIARLRSSLADHPRVIFILEGMNYDHPEVAFDLGREHENLWFTTARQPLEVIAEGVRRLGSHRLLFASGWPYLGESISAAVAEIRQGVDEHCFPSEVMDRILSLNAAGILPRGAR